MQSAAERRSKRHRVTAETDIELDLLLDGEGREQVDTGIPFFDHMLTLFTRHGLFDLNVKAIGDVDVDYHHTVEDVGIVLGDAFSEALNDKAGIRRYGFFLMPMDETLVRVALDFSGRSYLRFDAPARVDPIKDFSFTLVEEFMRAFTNHAQINLHMAVLYGKDSHHMAEACFKGLARAIDMAVQYDPRVKGVPSTKETLV